MSKISIRFFNDKEVRAIWDEESNKWWFSALDIVAVLGKYDDYEKARNYWKYLKAKLKKENNQEAVSKVCHPALDAGFHEKILLIIKGLRVKPAMT